MRRFWETVTKPVLEALQPASIVEIGSDEGGNTANLLSFCQENSATLHVIDPLPKYDVEEWRREYGRHLVFHEAMSLDALPRVEGLDVVLIDGDHNWYTVFNELRLIEERCEALSASFPLVLLHDIGWPYGRRDLYYDPDNIPEEHRKPYEKKGLHPDSRGLVERGGLNSSLSNASRENESRSGVLTAVEDFMDATNQRLELKQIPGVNGFGILAPLELKESNGRLAELLERLELSDTAMQLLEKVERERLEMQMGRQKYRAAAERSSARREREVGELQGRLRESEARVEDLRRQLAGATEHARRENESEKDSLKQQAENLKRLVHDRDSKLAELQEKLEQRSREIKWFQRELWQRRSAAEAEERSQDVERLARWIQELDAEISKVLDSRRWKAGYALSQRLGQVLSRPVGPPVPGSIQKIRGEFGAWRREAGQKEEQPAAPKQRPQPASVPAASPSPPGASKRLVSPEHVLEKLRDLPRITVLIPIHNAREDLERCLESVITNTTALAELLLVDDASTDPGVSDLLDEYARAENVRVLRNEENLGFVRTVNRGFSESAGDVVLLNSDTEVTPRWLENLILAAHADPRTATVTAVSDNAGAFSVPEVGKKNAPPEGFGKDDVGRLVTQRSGQVYPQGPTGNGFCMYFKRTALEEIGAFDAENFPRGYGEENDFCMRARKLGWNHVVDDATFVFHGRSTSFGEEKKELLEAGRAELDRLHPEYTRLARWFIASEDMQKIGENTRAAFESAEPSGVRPRVLFVHHQASGGTTYTNEDLMSALADRYAPYVLISNVLHLKLYRLDPDELVLVEQWSLRSKCQVTEFSRPDYREIAFDLLTKYRFELVHIRHLLGHTFDLPEVASLLSVPVVLSFHDFYFSCPTVHLLDDHGKHCGGICTPGEGQCTLPTVRLGEVPRLKHAWLGTWREQVQRMFGRVDAFVTTSQATRDIHLNSLPALRGRTFRVIEHGRDLEQAHCASPPADGPIRILIPGNINNHKGAGFIRALKQVDVQQRLEFHFLGRVAAEFRDLGVNHGLYDREEFNDRVAEISPAFTGIFSIWPETYCHTLTESWAAGVPVLASDIGTLRERVQDHGGGWLLDFEAPQRSYERILEIAADREEYDRELERADLRGTRSVAQMASDYEDLYEEVLGRRRAVRPIEKPPRTG